jgi:hypothetical protein
MGATLSHSKHGGMFIDFIGDAERSKVIIKLRFGIDHGKCRISQ